MAAFIKEMMELEVDFHTLEGIDYETFHATRMQYVSELCKKIYQDPSTNVLDIGRSKLSVILAGYYQQVSTLGFPLGDQPDADKMFKQHIIFDLNDCQTIEKLQGYEESFDLIVFAEVIEHIHTAPELIIHFLKSFLKPGGFLVCQTPNATALIKRIRLLLGHNPYERIRYDVTNPGHFREYTKQEMIEIGHKTKLEIWQHHYKDYFPIHGSWKLRLMISGSKVLSKIFPSFAEGQTIVYRNRIN